MLAMLSMKELLEDIVRCLDLALKAPAVELDVMITTFVMEGLEGLQEGA